MLYEELLSYFEPREHGRFLDGTLGMGGHSNGILHKAARMGLRDFSLLGLDRDTEALALARERLAPFDAETTTGGVRFFSAHSCFSDFDEVLDSLGWGPLDGAFIDIGVSSLQIDEAGRGFSFHADGPLDMRMDQSTGQPASALVNRATPARLKEILATWGEEPMAGRIARAIETARSQKPIETTLELAEIVSAAYPAKWRAKARNHPATRTFQALRMVVNNELDELAEFLRRVVARLNPGGRIAVITFHSLEDRMVKHFFRDEAQGCRCPRHVPVCICGHTPLLSVLTKKPVYPGQEEARHNPRASSAKLRVAEKLPKAERHRD